MAQWESQVVDNNQLTTISELTPHTIYTIRVQAMTSVGPGPLSPPVHVKTQQGKCFFFNDKNTESGFSKIKYTSKIYNNMKYGKIIKFQESGET